VSPLPPLRPIRLAPLLASAVLLCSPAFAADPPPPPPDGQWFGSGQGGLLIASGNSDAKSLNAKLDLARTDGPWKNTLHAAGLYGKNNGIENGDRLEARYQLDHKLSDRLFWFGSADAIRDRFSGFAYQATLSTGVGYKIVDDADTKLSGTLGAGYQRLETQQLIRDATGAVVQRINGPSQGGVVGVAGMDLAQKLTATTKLTDKLFVTAGSLDTAIANDFAVAVSMTDVLALSVGYTVHYNTKPASGVKKLDQLTTLNVVYNIK
jgi:putative salt-induced outer membrane protein